MKAHSFRVIMTAMCLTDWSLVQTAIAGEIATGKEELSCEVVFADYGARDEWISTCSHHDLFTEEQDPGWQVRADFIMLKRQLHYAPIVTNGGNTVVSSSQFDSNYSPGFELGARRKLGGVIADFRYFQVDSMNATLGRAGAVGDVVFNGTFIVSSIQSFAYGSDIYNAEFNLITAGNSWIKGLAGFRYVNYQEQVRIHADTGIGSVDLNSSTNNNLFGFQIGGEADLLGNSRRLQLNVVTKAGIYGVDSGSHDFTNVGGGILISQSASKNTVAFLGEIGLNGTYALTRWLSIEGGYRVLFIDGIALAGEQYSTTNLAVPVTRVNQGDVVLHGFNVGMVATW